jgi:hypothetical protein
MFVLGGKQCSVFSFIFDRYLSTALKCGFVEKLVFAALSVLSLYHRVSGSLLF